MGPVKRLLDLMAVVHYAAIAAKPAGIDRFRVPLRDFASGPLEPISERAVVVESATALPRSYTVSCVRRAPDRDGK